MLSDFADWLRLVYVCRSHLRVGFQMQNVYFDLLRRHGMQRPKQESKKEAQSFKRLVTGSGFSHGAADELWKWYNPSGKKGVASF